MSALRVAGLVVAAIAAGAVIGLAVLRGGDDEATFAPPLRGDVIAVDAEIEPRTHFFGEPVAARLDLVFDKRLVATDSVRVTAGFEPYRAGRPRVDTSRSGDLVRLRYRWLLECETQDCLPQGSGNRFDFQLGRIDFRVIDQGRSAQPFEWPPVDATSRVGVFDVDQARWRANTDSPPAITYRLSPGVLGTLLFGGAALLLAGAGGLAWQVVPRRALGEAGEDEERRISAIERALELALAHSANGGVPEQRKALERLARELGAEGLDELTHRARRLAWSPASPTRAEVETLAADVRAATGSKS